MMHDIIAAYHQLLKPSNALIEDITRLDGDILLLGAGGKMGPDLARLARRAVEISGVDKQIIAVSRFSEAGLREQLDSRGIVTVAADLLDDDALQSLDPVKNVIYLAGTKFGTRGKEAYTWAMNAYLPGRVAEKFKDSRIVVFSTGNVYPLVPVTGGGASEDTLPLPVGEYAQSCLGRERIFQYFSARNSTPVLIYRLNYANDVTYGILLEVARSVMEERPVDVSMGYVNIIWQGDANAVAIRALHHCEAPAKILNVTGRAVSIRWLAGEFGRMCGKTPLFSHEEQDTAYLSDATAAYSLFGEPPTSLRQMMELVVRWLQEGGRVVEKPTHFSERNGIY